MESRAPTPNASSPASADSKEADHTRGKGTLAWGIGPGEVTAAFLALGSSLAAARTPAAAARAFFAAADRLWRWDAGVLDLYSSHDGIARPVLHLDIVDGVRKELPEELVPSPAPPKLLHIVQHGAELILRRPGETDPGNFHPFGDTARRSASLMLVPIRTEFETVGVLSVQSYRPDAFDANDLQTAQALADYCAGALERIRIEGALQESEARFAKVFRTSPVAMGISRVATGIFVDVNESYIKQSGYAREELVGRSAKDLRLWVDPDQRTQAIERVRARGGLHGCEVRGRLKSGEIRDFLMSAELIEFGGESCFLGIFTDITDRNRAALALRRSEEKYRSLVETSFDVIWEVDSLGRYTYISPQVYDLLGYVEGDFVGHYSTEFMPPEEARRVEALLASVIGAREPFMGLEKCYLHKDGHPVMVESSGVPQYGPGGEFLGYRGSARDITDRKRVERERERRAEDLRAKNEELTRFNRVTVGRELRIVELKRHLNELSRELGRPEPYRLEFTEGTTTGGNKPSPNRL